MKLKSTFALVIAGTLGIGIPLAWATDTGAVPIEDLTLVEESESVTPAANVESRDRDGGRYDRGRYDRGRYDRGRYDRGRYDRGRYDRGRYDRGRYDRNGRHIHGVAPGTGVDLPTPRVGTEE